MGQFLWSGVSARPWNVAADRFARDLSLFEVFLCGALAAAECQTVGQLF
jgi:hypothetical protein